MVKKTQKKNKFQKKSKLHSRKMIKNKRGGGWGSYLYTTGPAAAKARRDYYGKIAASAPFGSERAKAYAARASRYK